MKPARSVARQPAVLPQASASPLRLGLTPRQLEIVRLLGGGLSYKEVAGQLHVSFSTVNNHLANIRKRLGAHKTVELLRKVDLNQPRKKVFVCGGFDAFDSGHLTFLEQSASYGEVYVGLHSDATMYQLKGRYPVCRQDERHHLLEALRCVKECWINADSGPIDFLQEIKALHPDILLVTQAEHHPTKADLCRQQGIEYIVAPPPRGSPAHARHPQ